MVINGITKYRAGAPPGLRNPTNIRRENFRGARARMKDAAEIYGRSHYRNIVSRWEGGEGEGEEKGKGDFALSG